MPTSIEEISLWFVTAVLGAAIVKIFDAAFINYKYRKEAKSEKVRKILRYLDLYGELLEYYRFYAVTSEKLVKNESGDFERDEKGEFIVDAIILEPEVRFRKAIEELKGTNLDASIAQTIVSIRLQAAEVQDICIDLDPSGNLKKSLANLYIDTVHSIEWILGHKDALTASENFKAMKQAIDKSGETRRSIRSGVLKHLR